MIALMAQSEDGPDLRPKEAIGFWRSVHRPPPGIVLRREALAWRKSGMGIGRVSSGWRSAALRSYCAVMWAPSFGGSENCGSAVRPKQWMG